MIRYNTTESKLEGYDGQWKSFESFDPSSQTASNSLPTNTDTTTSKAKLFQNIMAQTYATSCWNHITKTIHIKWFDALQHNNFQVEGWNGSQWLEFSFISPHEAGGYWFKLVEVDLVDEEVQCRCRRINYILQLKPNYYG